MTTIKIDKQAKKSRAIRVRNLIRKQKGILKTEIKTTRFKEPVMLFEKRNGDIEFYEDVTKGLFEYKHSDGTTRYQIIEPSTKRSFGFADKRFVGYISHEDYPITGQQKPLITAEQMNIIVEKSINDMKKWKAEEIREYKGMVKWIFIGIALIIIAYFIGKTLLGQPTQVVPTTTMIKDSAVAVINGTPTIIP